MAEFPKFPLWTDAYLGDTTHLTTTEHGAYLLLLITMWRAKDQRLPDDDRLLAKVARLTPTQWARMRSTIRAFFRAEEGFITQSRLTAEASAVRRHTMLQSDKAKAKWRKTNDTTDAAALPDACPQSYSLNTPLPPVNGGPRKRGFSRISSEKPGPTREQTLDNLERHLRAGRSLRADLLTAELVEGLIERKAITREEAAKRGYPLAAEPIRRPA